MLKLVFRCAAKALHRSNFAALKAWLAVALLFASSFATAASVCFNPNNLTIPGVQVTATGTCGRLTNADDASLVADGFWLKEQPVIGTSETCTLSFSPAVKNLTVDVGVHSCDPFSCEIATFVINGAHHALLASELLTPTDYSQIASLPGATTHAISITQDGNFDLLGTDVYPGNGSGKISFSEPVVSSIQITDTNVPNAELIDDADPGGSWFNVCYDGIAEPTLTISKVSQGGTGQFTFNGVAPNANGFSTNSSYRITTTASGTAVAGEQVRLGASNVNTDIQETAPAGWVLSSASCIDAAYLASGNPQSSFGTLTGNTLRIPATFARPGADLRCTFTNSVAGSGLSGKVILDTGAGAGVAHDAIQNGREQGHSGVVLSLTNCSTTEYTRTTTAGDGSFSLSLGGVPAGTVCLVESLPPSFNAVSVNVGSTAGTYNAGTTTLQFTLAANTGYSGIVLGEAPFSTLTSDGEQQAAAGQPVMYAHIYTPGSSGSVVFGTSNSATPPGLIWSSAIYRDGTCNGVLDETDTLLTQAVQVSAGDPPLCILVRVFTPAGAINGARDVTTLTATETWSVPTLSPTSQIHTLTNTDTTTVALAGLTLHKEVRHVTVCPSSPDISIADPTPYAASGSARPGDVLEYRLRYSNNTAAPLSNIRVFDAVQAFTVYKGALCLALPSKGVTNCAITAPVVGANSGSITWTMTDATTAPIGLQPLDSGSLSFCLQIQN
jgi:hypothetical protein